MNDLSNTPDEKQGAKPAFGNIASALATAQTQMGAALKTASNPHFRSKYADLASVMDACLPALNANGIAVVQPTGEDATGRYVETVLIHGESGERLSCRVPLIVQKNDMQGYGSAVTYARRYGLMSMAGIAPEDDDGNAAAKGAPVVDEMAAFRKALDDAKRAIARETEMDGLVALWQSFDPAVKADGGVIKCKDARKAELAPKPSADIGDDEIPYGG